MQGTTVTILEAGEKLQTFQNKLELLANSVEKRKKATFSNLDSNCCHEFLVLAILTKEISAHLHTLKANFEDYFSIIKISAKFWISRPFTSKLGDIDDDYLRKDELRWNIFQAFGKSSEVEILNTGEALTEA